MGMCSHAHDKGSDPVFTVACHISAGGLLSIVIEHCPELEYSDTAGIARLLSTALSNLAAAVLQAQWEAN